MRWSEIQWLIVSSSQPFCKIKQVVYTSTVSMSSLIWASCCCSFCILLSCMLSKLGSWEHCKGFYKITNSHMDEKGKVLFLTKMVTNFEMYLTSVLLDACCELQKQKKQISWFNRGNWQKLNCYFTSYEETCFLGERLASNLHSEIRMASDSVSSENLAQFATKI